MHAFIPHTFIIEFLLWAAFQVTGATALMSDGGALKIAFGV